MENADQNVPKRGEIPKAGDESFSSLLGFLAGMVMLSAVLVAFSIFGFAATGSNAVLAVPMIGGYIAPALFGVWYVRKHRIRKAFPFAAYFFFAVVSGFLVARYLCFQYLIPFWCRVSCADALSEQGFWGSDLEPRLMLAGIAGFGLMAVYPAIGQTRAPFSEASGQWFTGFIAKLGIMPTGAPDDPAALRLEDILRSETTAGRGDRYNITVYMDSALEEKHYILLRFRWRAKGFWPGRPRGWSVWLTASHEQIQEIQKRFGPFKKLWWPFLEAIPRSVRGL